ncbi:thioredoxin family protein [Olivibacter jilunii]|uniref:thioredoxin family protein n=1 Tax=Olivibacter jilunii TaxID=985016 RepID=UPI003F14B670
MMKSILANTLLYIGLILSPLLANAEDGVQFFEGSWKALLQLAKEQNKPIFVDVYTDWCPPCKRMDQEVLPLAAVGAVYNKAFINYKLNAERGEGIKLVKQYEVHAYPTYLYLTPEGVLLARVVDYQEPDTFMAYAHDAVAKNREQVLAKMDKQFQAGNRDPHFLKTYIIQKKDLGLDNSLAFDAYIKAQSNTERESLANIDFIRDNLNHAKGAAFDLLLKTYPTVDQTRRQKLAPVLFNLSTDAASAALQENRLQEIPSFFNQVDALKQQLSPKQRRHLYLLQLRYAQRAKDTETAKKAGYAVVANSMDISTDSIQAEDKRRYTAIMQPYYSGERDSTEITAEDKAFAQKIYTGEICVYLYEASNTFDMVLNNGDPALKDALRWAERLSQLRPNNTQFNQLIDRIKQKIN